MGKCGKARRYLHQRQFLTGLYYWSPEQFYFTFARASRIVFGCYQGTHYKTVAKTLGPALDLERMHIQRKHMAEC